MRRSSGKKRKSKHPVAGYGSETQVYHPLAWVSFIEYFKVQTLDKSRLFVYTKGTMIGDRALQKRLRVMRDRAAKSLENSRLYKREGDAVACARQQGRFQAYFDSWYLINDLINPTKKGGD